MSKRNGNEEQSPLGEILQCDMCRAESVMCLHRNQSQNNREGEHRIFRVEMGTAQLVLCTAQLMVARKRFNHMVDDLVAKGVIPGVVLP